MMENKHCKRCGESLLEYMNYCSTCGKSTENDNEITMRFDDNEERMYLHIALDRMVSAALSEILTLQSNKKLIDNGMYQASLDFLQTKVNVYLKLSERLKEVEGAYDGNR